MSDGTSGIALHDFVEPTLRLRPNGSVLEQLSRPAVEPLVQREEAAMPQGDKSSYTDKQKRKAAHIEEGYEDRGVSAKEAERRAWATVNKESGGGNKSGSGRGTPENHSAAKKGGKRGGTASAARSAEAKSASAKKAAATRAKKSG